MNTFSLIKKLTIVNIFVFTALNGNIANALPSGCYDKDGNPNTDSALCKAQMAESDAANRKDCNSRIDAINRDIIKSCKDSGISGDVKACVESANKCNDFTSNDSFVTDASVTQLMTSLGAVNPFQSIGCPQISGKDWVNDKKEFERDLQDIDKDIKRNKEDTAKKEKDFNDELKKINDNLKDKQKEIEKDKTATQEAKQKAKEDLTAYIRKQEIDIRKYQNDIIKKKAELDAQNFGSNMEIQTLQRRVDTVCKAQFYEELKKYNAMVAGNQSNNAFTKTKEKKEWLEKTWNECKNQQYDYINAKIKESQSKIDNIKQDISNILAAMEDLSKERKDREQNKQASDTANDQKVSKLEQDAVKEIQDAMTATETAKSNLLNEQKVLAEELLKLEQRKIEVNKKIALLGPQPTRSSSISQKEGATEIDGLYKRKDAIESECGMKKTKTSNRSSSGGTK